MAQITKLKQLMLRLYRAAGLSGKFHCQGQSRPLLFTLLGAWLLLFSSVTEAEELRPLPLELLSTAISSQVVYDEEFDYVKLGKFSNLNLMPQGSFIKKNLIDRVVVNKRSHQMLLYKDNQVVKKYWIALSNRPVGPKEFEGDKRTPEGTYTLDYIKEKSRFYKAFHISYPNPEDIRHARSLGRRPGGMIMVHGQPPSNSEYHDSMQRSDWTNGCIALLNPEMDEFISLVDVGTPIQINP